MSGNPELARESGFQPAAVLSVSALNRTVRDTLEHRFPLLWVAGEISNLTLARSGHLYFSLKDDAAQVRCVMFRNRGQGLDWQPREGLQVEVRALVTLYEPRGDFQLNIETMRRAGLGALYEAFVRLKEKLEREGLFDPASKRALPAYPRAIGVVTSLAAAALRDVLTTLARRNPSIPVIVYPTAVQGENAPTEIVAAIAAAGRRAECDVLIVCRGGGSIEDLWAFNDERVARAIRACPIPVVAGIGHETDFTIADFAADQRAPTPTAAAELVGPSRAELLARIAHLAHRLTQRTARDIDVRMQMLDHLARRLVHPGRLLDARAGDIAQLRLRLGQVAARSLEREAWRVADLLQRGRRLLPPGDTLALRLDQLTAQLRHAGERKLRDGEGKVEQLTRALEHLDPAGVLARGYSLTTDAKGRIVTDATTLGAGDRVSIRFARGQAAGVIEQSG